ncbi:MAG TPA: lipopolysaccharide kinase InaA family protein [Phycisphaerae bacterium]|nr:lipopolysaccharide kinase InaA family protein [Phycisphaerae bacterium]
MGGSAAGTPPPPGSEWVKRSSGRWTWQIRPDWVDLLDTDNCPDWLNLKDDPRATLIKTNDGRQVWRLQWGQHLLFAKISRPGRSWPRIRRWLLGPDAIREKCVADYAAAHGIDTVAPIAVGTAPFRGRDPVSILITLGLAHAVALNEFWSKIDNTAPNARRLRNEVIDATARLIASAHENGLEHTDLHAGNVLIESSGQTPCRALFVDLINIRTNRTVDEQSMLRNLAQFNQWFRTHATVMDRVRFLSRYLEWRHVIGKAKSAAGSRSDASSSPEQAATAAPVGGYHLLGNDTRAWIQGRRRILLQMERAAIDHANALYAKRDRRALRTGRYFAKLRLSRGWRAHVFLEAKHAVEGSPASRARFSMEQWQHWLQCPEDWIRGARREYVVKDSPSALVYRTRLDDKTGQSIDVICKRSIPRSFLKRVALLFRPSRPMRNWRLANALLNRQIPTARPLAVVERRVLGRPRDAFLITEYISHSHDLDTLLAVELREMEPARAFQLKAQIARALIVVLRRLHERGFIHRDLKAPNVMVQWDPTAQAAPRVLLVDLDGVRQVRHASQAAEIRALARLARSVEHCRTLTRTDRLRFLKGYLARPGRPEPEWREKWKAIEATAGHQRACKAT